MSRTGVDETGGWRGERTVELCNLLLCYRELQSQHAIDKILATDATAAILVDRREHVLDAFSVVCNAITQRGGQG